MKILLSKPGLDGHDVGVKVLAHALKEANFDIVYTGLRKSVETIVQMAKEHHVDVIGLSILSGTHLILCNKMNSEMTIHGLDIPWVVGGNIPVGDIDDLLQLGATAAFPTGTTVRDVVQFFKTLIVKA